MVDTVITPLLVGAGGADTAQGGEMGSRAQQMQFLSIPFLFLQFVMFTLALTFPCLVCLKT